MAGKQNEAARNFQKKKNTQNDKVLHYHCASHELILALTKALRLP